MKDAKNDNDRKHKTNFKRQLGKKIYKILVGGGAWGVDGGWMPLPTHPQRYCDPALLVLYLLYSRRNLGIYKAKVEKNRTKQIKAVFPSLGCIF